MTNTCYKIEKMNMPVIPLRGLSVFPYMVIHFDVGREKSMRAIEVASMKDSLVLLVTQKDPMIDNPSSSDYFQWGTVAKFKQMLRLPQGGMRVLVEGLCRGRIDQLTMENEYIEANITAYDYIDNSLPHTEELEALSRLVKSDIETYININPKISERSFINIYEEEDPGRLTDQVAAITILSEEEFQSILKELDVKKRLEVEHGILQKELDILKLEEKINVRVRNQMNQIQKEYYLREQIKAIRKELGEDEEIHAEIDELKKRIMQKEMPKEATEKALKELKRLSANAYNVAEAGVIRTYIDWILELPWQESRPADLDIEYAKTILDRDHYGLNDVKERIIEYLSVKKLNPDSKGNILLFVGPPGVGKTSIAKSIAEALDRDFVRMSLGGVRDEAEIRGHRRTYVGALPGRIISGLKKAGSNNPVFLLDEIDKINSDFRGDPASALLEVLDPEQNKDFTDHYLDLPFDLSQVLFLTTANSLDIPPALMDRMEIIHISGYTDEEKMNIATKYLVKKQMKNNGVTRKNFTITKGAINEIIEYYTREAGVRNLERTIAKVIRKSVVDLAAGKKDKVSVKKVDIESILGPRKYTFDLTDRKDRVGVANGLAWTSVGGSTLQVETLITAGNGKVRLTGKLGDVMKESAIAAVSYIRANWEELGVEEDFYKKYDIHVHVPEGAVPKDGPSAGITMATSILSALTKRPVDRYVAMTGELTITGRVLAIGGLKSKVLAAQRMGIKTVIVPEENRKDMIEIPERAKEDMEFIFVKNVGEVFDRALK
ncbi:MAG: endopeptidase La [Tissierellia bacterium]|nr:endopeptidase La [Tissierellia bacterium]